MAEIPPLQRIEEIARKAVFDPGSICARRPDESLSAWQAHAVTTALDCRGYQLYLTRPRDVRLAAIYVDRPGYREDWRPTDA